MNTILYIGEKSGFSEQLSNYLIRDGIAVEIQNTTEDCTSRILSGLYSLVMIDTSFCVDWIFTVVQIRQASDIPIILAENDRNQANAITAFKIGADDYLLKSIGVLEISLRIAAFVRRCGANKNIEKPKKETIFKDLRIDEYSRTVRKNGKELELTKTEFELLLFLVRHKGQVLTRE
ncbi:MAG: response regulator transcription factor [Firmicutes bacterium]|nr:response regulator transcription factor [Bacillota bacterium]